MRATELQLGDYLSYKGQIIKVKSITKKKVGYHIKPNECHMHYAMLCECKPIPLKRIHLTKNGFRATNVEDTEFVYRDGYEVKVMIEEDFVDVIFLSIEFAERNIWKEIEYLHELQQAMSIMGCDEEIEL